MATKTKPRILAGRLAKLAGIGLAYGSHSSPGEGMCAMEAAAFIAGRKHSDHPPCVSPVIGAFARAWNDHLNDEDRNRLIKPHIPDLIGTATTTEDDNRRAWLAADWLVRTYAPAWLRLAGMEKQAAMLESLGELNESTTPPILPTLNAIRDEADAAESAARSAARSAAWSAARSAAYGRMADKLEALMIAA
jgi:hypothetical protein